MNENERERARDHEYAVAARTAVFAVAFFMIGAAILGIATGSFTFEHFKPTVPPKSNPITVP